jgi:hypothetical protein
VALRLIVTLLFAPAILDKFMSPGEWARLFTTWGYPPWGPLVISIIEIIGLVALWIPAVTTSASAALVVTTAGATGTILVLIVWLALLQRERVRRESPT